jgi:putative oxidoreductase
MFRKLISTSNDSTYTVMRLVLGVVFFAHGAQKMLGWFGGPGLNTTIANFTQHMGIPLFFAYLAVIAEFFGAIGLIVGFLSRIAAFGILMVMVVAVVMVHVHNGLFMNWMGNQNGEGFEYHLLAMALALAIIMKGSGALSIDYVLTRVRYHMRSARLVTVSR